MIRVSLYSAFDLYPTSKGASTHIAKMAGFLFEKSEKGILYTLGNKFYPEYEKENNIEIARFSKEIPHYLDRAHAFSHSLENYINNNAQIELIHFRDIWSGLGIFQAKTQVKNVFEVNGLPSIELPYRYPNLKKSTIEKIEKLEDFCLKATKKIITPSEVILQNLVERGIPQEKITVIPNAAENNPEFSKNFDPITGKYLIYFGAVQPWQGIDTLLKAFAGLKDLEDLKLLICCSNRHKDTKIYRKLADKLEISNNIIWKYQLEKPVLNSYIKNALISLAPLRECTRNIKQGCSPLKIYESMACGTPVIASDLPVTREIIDHNTNGKLVIPDRPQELSRAIRILLEFPENREQLGKNGRESIVKHSNWEIIRKKMFDLYNQL